MKLRIRLPSWWRSVVPWVAWPAFYFFTLLLFARCTFPYDRIAQRATATFNAAQAQTTGRRLEIESLNGYWLFGARARGVRLITPPPPPGEDGKPLPPQVTELETAWASISPLRALLGTLRLAFGAGSGDGRMNGRFFDPSEERRVDVEFEGMPVENLPMLAQSVGVPLGGRLTGSIDLVFPEKRLSLTEGKLELVVDDLTVADGKTKIRDFAALPRINAGKLELSAEVTEGKLQITKFEAKGPDLEVTMSGSLRLRDLFATSVAELVLRFRFTDKYKTKNDMTKGLFGDPGSAVPGLLDMNPRMKSAKQDDGGYVFSLNGPVSRLSFSPGGSIGGADSEKVKSRPTRRRPATRRKATTPTPAPD